MTTPTINVSDHRLQDNVRAELVWTPQVDDAAIGVSVLEGVVTLSGEVDNHAQEIHARQAASRVAGVSVVASELTLRHAYRPERNDTDIALSVKNVLGWSADIPQGRVTVEVHDHVVELSGSLDWNYQREDVGRMVRGLLGVVGVENRIELTPRISATDTAKHIRGAFVRHALLDADSITVTTVGSEVTLTGEVSTWAETNEAARSAWASPNVTAVHNKLKVRP